VSQRLNLTQREFGVLLAPSGGSSISPSVICQLESALQTVPPALVARAVAATTAAQQLGDHLCAREPSGVADAASALKALGPGCIDELGPFMEQHPNVTHTSARQTHDRHTRPPTTIPDRHARLPTTTPGRQGRPATSRC
jgi:hypothetical protein